MIPPVALATAWKTRIPAKEPIDKDKLEKSFSFLADVHLGRLARMLRMLGFDTAYRNNHSNGELLKIALDENRILLSRNIGFNNKPSIRFLLITDEDPVMQLKQVVAQFALHSSFQPFSRCIVCNGCLERKEKENIAVMLPENTKRYYNEFWQCSGCNKIYWKGSHYERMLKLLKTL